jgi:hypothetical protein
MDRITEKNRIFYFVGYWILCVTVGRVAHRLVVGFAPESCNIQALGKVLVL